MVRAEGDEQVRDLVSLIDGTEEPKHTFPNPIRNPSSMDLQPLKCASPSLPCGLTQEGTVDLDVERTLAAAETDRMALVTLLSHLIQVSIPWKCFGVKF